MIDHTTNPYPAPCHLRHNHNGDMEASEGRYRGDCLVKWTSVVDDTLVEIPKIYCRRCCPVCGEETK